MRARLLGLVVVALASSCGGTSGIRATCAQAKACGQLGSKSEAQCVTEKENLYQSMLARHTEVCNRVAADYDTLAACVGRLSCDTRTDQGIAQGCQGALTEYEAAINAANGSCGDL